MLLVLLLSFFSFLLRIMHRVLLGRGMCIAKYCSWALHVTGPIEQSLMGRFIRQRNKSRGKGIRRFFISCAFRMFCIYHNTHDMFIDILIPLTPIWSPTSWNVSMETYGYRNWYQDWGHCGVTNDLGSSPQPEGEALGLWWASWVVGDTTMTEIEVSISILSWCLKAY